MLHFEHWSHQSIGYQRCWKMRHLVARRQRTLLTGRGTSSSWQTCNPFLQPAKEKPSKRSSTLQADVGAGEGDLHGARPRDLQGMLQRQQRLRRLVLRPKGQRRQRAAPKLNDIVQSAQLRVDALVHLSTRE